MSGQSSSKLLPSGRVEARCTGRSNTAERASSKPGSSLRSTEPSGKVISTGGAGSPATGSAT